MTPDESAWKGYKDDPGLRRFHDLVFGKSNAEIQSEFGEGRSIEMADDLRIAPQPVFEYYIQGFCQFILSDKSKNDPDSASSFLGLLVAREQQSSGSVCRVFDNFKEALQFIGSNQKRFDADEDIYGDFSLKVASICETCKRKLY